jgi:uncharacterized membrane protein YkoI
MNKTLVMLYNIYGDGLYTDILNVETTEGQNIDTFEKARQIIVDNYANRVTNWDIIQEGNEVYITSDGEMPCLNCPE